MKVRRVLWLPVVLALVGLVVSGCATADKSAEPAAAPWKFHDIVDTAFVQPYATVPQPEGVMIIDSRPRKPKFVNGHLPTAVSIPDSQFAKLKANLPTDKNALLIFYCQGPT